MNDITCINPTFGLKEKSSNGLFNKPKWHRSLKSNDFPYLNLSNLFNLIHILAKTVGKISMGGIYSKGRVTNFCQMICFQTKFVMGRLLGGKYSVRNCQVAINTEDSESR